jgi:hypothetical protein
VGGMSVVKINQREYTIDIAMFRAAVVDLL